MAGDVIGVVLAGGLSRRMGGKDKALLRIGGKTILAHVIGRIRPQVGGLVLNANGDPDRFSEFGLPIAPDTVAGHAGPLAGVLTGLEWAAGNAPACSWVATVPTDAPFLPEDLVARLLVAVAETGADLACAGSAGRAHPVCGLWPVRLRGDLRRAMVEEGIRKVDTWTARYRLARADFSADPLDPFFNANTPDDLAEAERLMAEGIA